MYTYKDKLVVSVENLQVKTLKQITFSVLTMCKNADDILKFESEVILSGLKVQFTCFVFTQSSHFCLITSLSLVA